MDALEDRAVDDNGGSGSGIGQQWMMTTTMMTAAAGVDVSR